MSDAIFPPPGQPARASRLPTFRTSLTLSLVGVALALVAALFAGQLYSSSRLIRRTIKTIMSAHLKHDQALVGSYFDGAQRQLFAAEHWAKAGQLSPLDTAGAARLLMPLCDSTVQISAAYLTDTEDNTLTLRRSSGGWESVSQQRNAAVSTFTTWPEPHNLKGRSWSDESIKNTSVRQLADSTALAGGEVTWSGLVEDGPGGPGVLVAKQLDAPSGELVLAYEISLWDLDALLDEMHPTPSGYAVLLDQKRELLERNPPPGSALPQNLEAPHILQLKEKLVDKVLSDWRPESDKAFAAAPDAVTSFTLGGERWWAATAPLSMRTTVWGSTNTVDVQSSASLVLLAFIPESDLFAELRGQRIVLLEIGFAILVFALLLGGRVAKSYSAPLADLVTQSERMQRLELSDIGLVSAASVREIEQLSAAHENMRRGLDSFSRYVPISLVRELLDRGEAAQIGGQHRTLTILITDVRHFTALCEQVAPDALAAQLAEYFGCLLGVLRDGGATIDKLVGDSVVSFWGAPHEDAQQTEHAVATALIALSELDELNQRWEQQGRPRMETKVGITRGDVVVGNVGSSWRLNYTAMGDAVNLASRLQQLCPGQSARILTNAAVFNQVSAEFAWRKLGAVEIRGRHLLEDIYEPLAKVAPTELELDTAC